MKTDVHPSPSGISLLIVLLAVVAVNFAPMSAFAQTNPAVPSAWLDSLVANEWRIENDGMFGSYRIRKIETMLKKSGEIKQSDTSFILVKIDENGLRERFLTDEAGVITEPMLEDPQNSREALQAIHLESRLGYSYAREAAIGLNRVKITCTPKPDEADAMFTIIEVDTTNWLVVSIESIPTPLPPKVKELKVLVDYEPYGDYRARPAKLTSHAHAAVLFLQIYLRVEMEFFDYQK